MRRIPRHGIPRGTRSAGFTLIEIMIAIGLLGAILYTSYKILTDCLRTEKEVEISTQPEKVGEAIIALMRRDLLGAFYKGMTEQLENQVFEGVDNGTEDEPEDSIFFLTSVDPTPREDLDEGDSMRSLMAVGYYLERGEVDGITCYGLYRKEITDLGTGDFLQASGMNFVIYDKVKSLSFEYSDGYYDPQDDPSTAWLLDWSSVRFIEEMEAEIAEESAEAERQPRRIGRVSETESTLSRGGEAEEEALAQQEPKLPPAPIPVAVRVEVEIYAGSGNKIFRNSRDEPILRKFSTIVSLPAAQRFVIRIDEMQEELGLAGGAEGELGDLTEDDNILNVNNQTKRPTSIPDEILKKFKK